MSSISVIIPAYNAEKFIAEAIESVLTQTRPAKEIIVVDDASGDGTVARARACSPVVRVVENAENRGVGARRNQGVQMAQGEFVAFLDADDKWAPDHLAHLGALLDRHESAGLAFSQVRIFHESTGIWPCSVSAYLEPNNAFFDMMRNVLCLPSSCMVRRRVHEAIGGFDESAHWRAGRRIQAEDTDYLIRASRIAKFVASPEPSVWYRWHANQASVLRGHQMVLSFAYRVKILNELRNESVAAPDLTHAQHCVLRCWEEHIDEAWATRNMSFLRAMVRYGLGVPLFRCATLAYVWRACLPDAAVRSLMAWNLMQPPVIVGPQR